MWEAHDLHRRHDVGSKRGVCRRCGVRRRRDVCWRCDVHREA